MKETVRSISIWFLISGGFSIYNGINAFMQTAGLQLLYLYAALLVVLGVAVFGAGIFMQRLLKDSPGVVIAVLIGGMVVLAFTASLLFYLGARSAMAYFDQIVGFAISIYLFFNVKRLSKELQASEGESI
jgi:hypothetical protein